MSKQSPLQLAQEWERLVRSAQATVAQRLHALVQSNQTLLTGVFYESLQPGLGGRPCHSRQATHTLTAPLLQRWLVSVLSVQGTDSLLPVVAQQVRLGDVLTRMELPMHLVLHGSRQLKARLQHMLDSDPLLDGVQKHAAWRLASELLDLSMEIVCQAYAEPQERLPCSDNCRWFAMVQNPAAEYEKQKGTVLAWLNEVLSLLLGQHGHALPPLGDTAFGHWLQHDVPHTFHSPHETAKIQQVLLDIDESIVPALRDSVLATDEVRQRHLNRLQAQVDHLLDHLRCVFPIDPPAT